MSRPGPDCLSGFSLYFRPCFLLSVIAVSSLEFGELIFRVFRKSIPKAKSHEAQFVDKYKSPIRSIVHYGPRPGFIVAFPVTPILLSLDTLDWLLIQKLVSPLTSLLG